VQRMDRGPSRRERRAALKGIPRGRRPRQVVTTYGQGQRDRARREAWAAARAAELAAQLAAAPAGTCSQCGRPARLINRVWVDAEDADPRCLATPGRRGQHVPEEGGR